MPRYAPLPAVNIDPRNEAELVNAAAKRVYDASNAKLNDFSAGNPLIALLEGQAFAQGEFLFWANQLPESILLEWIGPFLGAMRRLGTASTTRLLITIAPQNSQFTLPAGTQFASDANLTGGQSIPFVTTQDVSLAANQTTASVEASSSYVGTFNNIPAFTITGLPGTDVPLLSVTNTIPAQGGSDIETLDAVKERFFTLIRRRNPVSSQDWQDLFVDLFGVGTYTSVLPNRSSKDAYLWDRDYAQSNGHVSFFVLNPDGTEITETQVRRAQNVVNFSLPLEMEGHVYPMNLSQVQFELDLRYDPNANYAGYLQAFALSARDALYQVMTPGVTWPSGYNPTVADVDSALLQTLPANTRYYEPDIIASRAYNTPLGVNAQSVQGSDVFVFEPTGETFTVNDLFTVGDPDNPLTASAWPVLQSFTPYSSDKKSQLLAQNLVLKKILTWSPQSFSQSDLIKVPFRNELFVVLRNFELTDANIQPENYVLDGYLSAPKVFSPWVEGNQYVATDSTTGLYDPDIVSMEQVMYSEGPCLQEYFAPPSLSNIPLIFQPGWYAYVVNQNFTLGYNTNYYVGAQGQGLISQELVSIPLLQSGGTYQQGTWVRTPGVGSGPDAGTDPYYNYVDITKGTVIKYAYVNETFTFIPESGLTLSEQFDSLVAAGLIVVVNAYSSAETYSPFEFQPRFEPQVYLTYRDTGSSPLQIYFSLTGFTPYSSDMSELEAAGLISRVDTTPELLSAFLDQSTPDPLTGRSVICPPEPMFVFTPGDTTLFRAQDTVVAYAATQHFTPIFSPQVYIAAGVLVESDGVNQSAIPFYDPMGLRRNEDVIVSEDGHNFYRVMRYFTPSPTIYNWDGIETVNTTRLEELNRNLLRVVNLYTCEQPILAPQGVDVSGTKLGIAQILLTSKINDLESNWFVWENTKAVTEVPQLSYSTGGKQVYQPVSYGKGTLAL